jgi:phosphatidylinositol alpha-1,6-mannosyltransferase
LSVGRLVSRKGFDLALQALPLIRQQVPDVHLEIAGDGPERPRLEQMVSELELQTAVTFSGRLSDQELLAAYQHAHLFIMPAREELANASVEGFGIVYLEASACGLPVVATRTGGVAEAVQDGRTGLLIPPDDPIALATAVTTLLQNPEKMHQMGANGREWIANQMNWDVAAQQLSIALELHP